MRGERAQPLHLLLPAARGRCRELGCAPSQPLIAPATGRSRWPGAAWAAPGLGVAPARGRGGRAGSAAHLAAPGAVHPRAAPGIGRLAFHRCKMAAS